MAKKVGIELSVKLPEGPKRPRQEELVRVIRLLAIAVVLLAAALGGPVVIGLVLRLLGI